MSGKPHIWALTVSAILFVIATGHAAAAPVGFAPDVVIQTIPEIDSSTPLPSNCSFLTSAFGIAGEITQCRLSEIVGPGDVVLRQNPAGGNAPSNFSDVLRFSDANGNPNLAGNLATLYSEGTNFGTFALANDNVFQNENLSGPTIYFALPNTYTIDSPNLSPVPEPSTIVLMAPGLLGMTWFWRRRRRPSA